MKTNLPAEYFWDEDIESNAETSALMGKVWPRYLLEKGDIDDHAAPTSLSDHALTRRFRMWGIRRKEDRKLVAFASAVMISTDQNRKSYPNEGWRYALNAYYAGGAENCLCLLSANVDPDYRNLKFSYSLIQAAKELAASLGLSSVLAPVRPTQKAQFPLLPIREYLEKKSDDGEIYDPWLRVHAKLGGEILNICTESVVVKASFSKWEEWLGSSIEGLNMFVPEMGLVPITVESEKIGVYCEPNVWVRYLLQH